MQHFMKMLGLMLRGCPRALWAVRGHLLSPRPSSSSSSVAKSCLTLVTLWRLTCSSIHGISQARILEWVAISFSRASSQPRD